VDVRRARKCAIQNRYKRPAGENRMFIAMNRFKVLKDQQNAFETMWLTRESKLDEVKGFVAFHLLRGPEREDHVLYSSHTVWATQDDFIAWTKSEQFRFAHKNAGDQKPKTLGHPEFEGFEVIQSLENTKVSA
jgi:heme-degrading monooxygenase HmoA